MNKERLAAFSDGVIAVIITIMVLEMKVPHGSELGALWPLAPIFGSYVLSFVYVGIYLNNHHHLLHAVQSINGRILWANVHLLFWLSLIPFCSGWMGENHFDTLPVALYGVVLLMCGIAYYILAQLLIAHTVISQTWRSRWAATSRELRRFCSISRPFRSPSSARQLHSLSMCSLQLSGSYQIVG